MPLDNPFKLEKLKIHAYRQRARQPGHLERTFEAMFNPASLSRQYQISYGSRQGAGTSATEARFTMSRPQDLEIELLFDGTGVETIGLLSFFQPSVQDRVKDFLDTAYELNGSTHEPHYLTVQWGDGLSFDCRLKTATVTYTSFDRGGNPLRAKLAVHLMADTAADLRAATDNLMSPDVTHTRTVVAGDTLPLLAEEVYGSPHHHRYVAEANDLDDPRLLTPGQTLVFPPLPEPGGRS